MESIFFSILIPAYKVRFLSETIQSCLNQSYSKFEIVIVDDASPEDIQGTVAAYKDSRIRFYRNKENCGAVNVVDNWNKCLEYAHGDYVICIGDDDLLTSHCLEDYVDIITKYPGLNVYHTRTLLIDENSTIWNIQEERPVYESGYSLWWFRWNGRDKQYLGDFLFLRQHLIDNGGFFKLPLAWASDDITAVRAAIPKGIGNVSRAGFMYRQSPITISMTASEQVKAEATLKEKEWYQDLLSESIANNEEDSLLITLIKGKISDHFCEKVRQSFLLDIYSCPFHFIYWYKNCSSYSIPKMKVLKFFCKSLVRKLLSICC